jgi:chaperone modulatory protein CbpM
MDSNELQFQAGGIIWEEQTELTLDDICRACVVQTDYIIELVEEGVLVPTGRGSALWRFTGWHTHQVNIALRLQRDLGINLAGVALVLQLLSEVEALRERVRAIESE